MPAAPLCWLGGFTMQPREFEVFARHIFISVLSCNRETLPRLAYPALHLNVS